MCPRPTSVVGKSDLPPNIGLLQPPSDVRGRRRSEPHPVGHRGGLAGAVEGFPLLLTHRLCDAHLDP